MTNWTSPTPYEHGGHAGARRRPSCSRLCGTGDEGHIADDGDLIVAPGRLWCRRRLQGTLRKPVC
eukprot:8348512-Alexandrium_andersonii.AAC.1